MISVPKSQTEAISLWKEDRKVSALLNEEESREAFTNIIANEIMVYISIISAHTNINKDNVYIVAERFLAMDGVKHLSLREIKGFLKSAFEQKYGKIYGGFGLDTLITWFNEYYSQRDIAVGEFSHDEHLRLTGKEKALREKPFAFGNGPSIGEVINEQEKNRKQ